LYLRDWNVRYNFPAKQAIAHTRGAARSFTSRPIPIAANAKAARFVLACVAAR